MVVLPAHRSAKAALPDQSGNRVKDCLLSRHIIELLRILGWATATSPRGCTVTAKRGRGCTVTAKRGRRALMLRGALIGGGREKDAARCVWALCRDGSWLSAADIPGGVISSFSISCEISSSSVARGIGAGVHEEHCTSGASWLHVSVALSR